MSIDRTFRDVKDRGFRKAAVTGLAILKSEDGAIVDGLTGSLDGINSLRVITEDATTISFDIELKWRGRTLETVSVSNIDNGDISAVDSLNITIADSYSISGVSGSSQGYLVKLGLGSE